MRLDSKQTTVGNKTSTWSPLGNRNFRRIWLSTIAANIGMWMHEVGAGWLMTSLSLNPLMVALVQAAATAPVFLLALPAGALSDIVDRRHYLIATQIWMFVVAISLAFLTLFEVTSAWMLVGLTFCMGIGGSLMAPAWSAILPEVVRSEEIPAAVALNSLAFNFARALGPALAGIIISSFGNWAVFFLNSISFVLVICVLYAWKREVIPEDLPAERFASAIRVGIGYAIHSPVLKAAGVRAVAFFVFSSCLWALLPLLAKQLSSGSAQAYSVLVSSIGIGALVGVVALPRVRKKYSTDHIVSGATAICAIAMFALAQLSFLPLMIVMMMFVGIGWTAVYCSIQLTTQLALPNWVRSRGLALFMVVFMGSMSGGSLLWGFIAAHTSVPTAMIIASIGALVCILLAGKFPLAEAEQIDHTPAMDWEAPAIHEEVTHDKGPVMVMLRYKVRSDVHQEFRNTLLKVRLHRRRHGAYSWSIYQDSKSPNVFFEVYMMESWLEHLRKQQRLPAAFRELQESLLQYLEPGEQPTIRRWLAS